MTSLCLLLGSTLFAPVYCGRCFDARAPTSRVEASAGKRSNLFKRQVEAQNGGESIKLFNVGARALSLLGNLGVSLNTLKRLLHAQKTNKLVKSKTCSLYFGNF